MKNYDSRLEIEEQYKWKLSDIYPDESDWERDYARLRELIPRMARFKGQLAQSALYLYEALKEMDGAGHISEKLFVYARMKRDENNANSVYSSLTDRAYSLNVELGAALSYVNPELTSIPEETLRAFLGECPPLKAEYDFMIEEIIRSKSHILSPEQELLLSRTHEFSAGPKDIFTMLDNADLTFGSVKEENGEKTPLTHGTYQLFLQSRDRKTRKKAFKKYYAAYKGFINTIASTYSTSVKKDVFYAKARGYGSALEHALFSDNVPVALYKNLIGKIHDNLSVMYRYVALRKKLLGVDTIHMYDIFAPLVDFAKKEYTYEEARRIALDALSPLGAGYVSTLEKAFESGWVDVFETKGKTSGAYSWGVYGTHPYVLLNHREDLNSVYTLLHEMGHAMHTYYSDEKQPYSKAGYAIFVAEVASTVNEILLTRHLIKTEKDEQVKKYILNYYLDQFRTTVFRQTMFAEFEMITHEMAERSEPLTPDSLSYAYGNLNALYYGPEMAGDDDIRFEWARIPHFYNAFYVYKYATGFSCAVKIADMILKEGEDAAKRYMAFLSSGGSDYPLELLKIAGVDLISGEPVDACMSAFSDALDEFAGLAL